MTVLGTIAAGSMLVAAGDFTADGYRDLLWNTGGNYSVWLLSGTGIAAVYPVTIPAGDTIVGVGQSEPGLDSLIVTTPSGTLDLATLSQSGTAYVTSLQTVGTLQPGFTVQGAADYEGFYGEFGLDPMSRILTGDGSGHEQIFPDGVAGTIMYANDFNLPSGFTVVPHGTGNFLGAEVGATLLQNATGTVEVVLNPDMNSIYGYGTSSVLGTLSVGETISAVGLPNQDGSTDVLLQQSGTLYEWVVREGAISETISLGALSSGYTVSGMGDTNGDGIADVLLMNNTGTVQVIENASDFVANNSLLSTLAPVVMEGAGYGPAYAGNNLTDYLNQLGTRVSVSANGTRILALPSGILADASFSELGNISMAEWEQNVAALNAIAQYCRANGITVKIETNLGWNGGFGSAQTYQWLLPSLAAGLPIGYVDDDQEFGVATSITNNGTTVTLLPNGGQIYGLSLTDYNNDRSQITNDLSLMAQNEGSIISIIRDAIPNVVFGEWDVLGNADSGGTLTAYHDVLQQWLTIMNSGSLPNISYIIADELTAPNLATATSASNTGQGSYYSGNNNSADVASIAQDAASVGVLTVIQDGLSPVDLNSLQALARQELEVSQQAGLGIAGIQMAPETSPLPSSAATASPGSSANGVAEVAAVTPLYQHGDITTTGSIALTLPTQTILGQNSTVTVSGITIAAAAGDASHNLAVVLIDQTGTLSATQHGSATVTSDGPNVLILNGTPSDIASELASVTLTESVAGPDNIDVEVFGSSGRVAGGTITVLSTLGVGGTVYTPGTTGALAQIWNSATAVVSSGRISTEILNWNTSDGINSAEFTGGGGTIIPINQLLVDQPLLEQGITASGTVASLPTSILSYNLSAPPGSTWQIYDPLVGSSAEGVPVVLGSSTMTYDSSGRLETQTDTIVSVTTLSTDNFPFSPSSFYFLNGGSVVTEYNTGSNPNWPSTGSLYDNGGGITVIPDGSTLEITDGSPNPMTVGAIQTIYGNVSGTVTVVEVRYLGDANNPYDEVDQVFNPYSATPQLWQQIQSVDVPASMASSSPLPVPSLTTVTEYNTGNNPDWNASAWGSASQVSTTYDGDNWASAATITAGSTIAIAHGVTWFGEDGIINAYTLATPGILGWTAKPGATGDTLEGTGIAGDYVTISFGGTLLASAEVDASGLWQVADPGTPAPSSTSFSVREYDLAADSSVATTATTISSWVIGSATNFAGLGGTDSFVLNGSTELGLSAFSSFGTTLASVPFLWASDGNTSPEGHALILDQASQITSTGTNLLGHGGADFVDTIGASGTIGTYEVNATGTILAVSGAVEIFGSGDSITATNGSTLFFDSGTGDALSLSQGSVTIASSMSINISGSSDTVTAVSGTTIGLSGTAEVVHGSGAIINAGSQASITMSGSNDQVTAAAGATLGFSAGGETVTATGVTIFETTSSANVTIIGTNDLVGAVSGSTMSFSGTLETVNASGANIYETSSSASVSVSGNNNVVSAVSGSVLGITGTGETVTASGITVYCGASTDITLIGTTGTDVVGLYTNNELMWGASYGIGFITGSSGSHSVYASVGSQTYYGFSMSDNDQIDLSQILAGTGVNASTIGTYVTATSAGADTTLSISGPHGSDSVLLAGAGALTLSSLTSGNAFVY